MLLFNKLALKKRNLLQIRVGGRLGVGKNVPVLVQLLRREHLVIAQFTCAAAAERRRKRIAMQHHQQW